MTKKCVITEDNDILIKKGTNVGFDIALTERHQEDDIGDDLDKLDFSYEFDIYDSDPDMLWVNAEAKRDIKEDEITKIDYHLAEVILDDLSISEEDKERILSKID